MFWAKNLQTQSILHAFERIYKKRKQDKYLITSTFIPKIKEDYPDLDCFSLMYREDKNFDKLHGLADVVCVRYDEIKEKVNEKEPANNSLVVYISC